MKMLPFCGIRNFSIRALSISLLSSSEHRTGLFLLSTIRAMCIDIDFSNVDENGALVAD